MRIRAGDPIHSPSPRTRSVADIITHIGTIPIALDCKTVSFLRFVLEPEGKILSNPLRIAPGPIQRDPTLRLQPGSRYYRYIANSCLDSNQPAEFLFS
jgi:hypothetical protein